MLNFVVNALSGKGRGDKNLKKIVSYCDKNSIEYTVHLTSSPTHATRITKALCENNAKTIVAIGGDGTFHEVLNGLTTPSSTALGFIPSGRGNDFARAANLNRDPIKALEDIIRGEKITIDYIQVGDKRCLNIAGTGLDVAVLEQVSGKTGKITYLKSLIYCIKHFDPYKLTVKHNGVESYHECIMVGVCNGKAFGGGMILSPLSKIDDGIMDILIIRMPDDKKIMKALFKFTKGKHLGQYYVDHVKCDEVIIESPNNYPIQLDGEIYYDHPLHCKIVKGGLTTFKTANKFND